MDKNLIDIVKENIKSNQVVLIATAEADGSTSLAVEVSHINCTDPEVEKQARFVAMVFSGILSKFGDVNELVKLAELGYKVVQQQAALQEAEKE